MKILVTGGRHYGEKPAELDHIHRELDDLFDGSDVLIHGDCPTGADHFAKVWAQAWGIRQFPYPVNNTIDGPWPGAGPRRNQRMYDVAQPDVVVAFPGGRGTASMMRIARAGKTPVYELQNDDVETSKGDEEG